MNIKKGFISTSMKAKAMRGVSSAGLRMQVHPHAMEAATFRQIIPMGKFH